MCQKKKENRTLRSRQTSSLGDQVPCWEHLTHQELWAFLRSPALIYRNFLVSFQCSSRKVTKQRQSKQIEEDSKRKKATKVPMNNFLAFGYRTRWIISYWGRKHWWWIKKNKENRLWRKFLLAFFKGDDWKKEEFRTV